jgi:uncharacterized protein (DUF488 family)
VALYSIGHSNHPAALFRRLLAQVPIALLVDVRSRPASRFCPQFNRKALEAALAADGREYRFAGAELGGRDGISVRDPRFQRALGELVELARKRELALMCSEREPERCHRATKLAAWIHRFAPGERLTHLVPCPDGRLERVDSLELEARLEPGRIWPELVASA